MISLFHTVWRICSLLIVVHVTVAQKGEYRGCFLDSESARDLPLKITTISGSVSVPKCVDSCTEKYFLFAGIQAGRDCFCGSGFGKYGVANCSAFCEGDSQLLCGGVNANSIYTTGFMVPGPPKTLTLTTARENSLVVRWSPPQAANGIIISYKAEAQQVSPNPDGSPSSSRPLQWSFSNITFETELAGLSSATHYNITIQAASAMGDGVPISALFWTDVSEPERPPMAEIIRVEGRQMTIQLPEVMPTRGPITAYRVVVYDETDSFPLDPVRLADYQTAKSDRLPFYIAAELLPQQARTNFVVGDGGSYGGYYNPPLGEDRTHTVIVGVVSRLNNVTKVAYSSPATYQAKPPPDVAGAVAGGGASAGIGGGGGGGGGGLPMVTSIPEVYDGQGFAGPVHEEFEIHQEVYDDSALVTGLGVAVGIGAALLVASVIIYFLLRYHYGQRQQPDHQELTLQSPSPEVSENGITSSILVMEEDGDLDFMFDSLKDKFWNIPLPHLEITDEVLGQGRFGVIQKAVAHRKNHQIPVSVQVVQAHLSDNERERRSFLNDLDALIKIGTHTNVIGILGGCEERAILRICTEWYPGNLKEFLLDSRTMEHYPVYAERQHRMSTLKELQLLELSLGVARGMAHLANNKLIHRRLTSRSIVVVDDITAKVTDFGLTQIDYEPPYDLTRWMPMESLKSRVFASKSDVWMFGVVLWEIMTLGGTPYAAVKTKDVSGRVLRGSRLTQPKNIGDDLYQIMLQCWQVVLDERPSFQELTSILGTMVTEGADIEYLHLELFPGFQYEKFDREAEQVSAAEQ